MVGASDAGDVDGVNSFSGETDVAVADVVGVFEEDESHVFAFVAGVVDSVAAFFGGAEWFFGMSNDAVSDFNVVGSVLLHVFGIEECVFRTFASASIQGGDDEGVGHVVEEGIFDQNSNVLRGEFFDVAGSGFVVGFEVESRNAEAAEDAFANDGMVEATGGIDAVAKVVLKDAIFDQDISYGSASTSAGFDSVALALFNEAVAEDEFVAVGQEDGPVSASHMCAKELDVAALGKPEMVSDRTDQAAVFDAKVLLSFCLNPKPSGEIYFMLFTCWSEGRRVEIIDGEILNAAVVAEFEQGSVVGRFGCVDDIQICTFDGGKFEIVR